MSESVLRQACDRCHGQKLRCKRDDGETQCARCIKAGATCVYSNSLRNQRTAPGTATSSAKPQTKPGWSETLPYLVTKNPLPHWMFSQDMDNIPDATEALRQGPNPMSQQQSGNAASRPNTLEPQVEKPIGASGNSSKTAYSDTPQPERTVIKYTAAQYLTNWNWSFPSEAENPQLDVPNLLYMVDQDQVMRDTTGDDAAESTPNTKSETRLELLHRLSDLNVQLLNEASLVRASKDSSASHHEGYAIDKIFSQSKDLIEILNQIVPRPQSNPFSGQDQAISTLSGSSDKTDTQSLFADVATLLFILSVYLRVIDMYDWISEQCQEYIIAVNQGAATTETKAPRLNLGAFNTGHSSVLRLTTVIALSEHVLRQLSEILEYVDKANRDSRDLAPGYGGQTDGKINLINANVDFIRARQLQIGVKMKRVIALLQQSKIV